MAIQIPAGQTVTYTAAQDVILQNTGSDDAKFQTDQSESEWGILYRRYQLLVEAGQTIYLTSAGGTVLAEIKT